MNSRHNLPIVLRYEEDGSIVAHCPLLPECHAKSTSRSQVLRTMQLLIKQALATPTETPQKAVKYEVVHLAIAHASDAVDTVAKRGARRPKTEGASVELL